MTIYQYRDDVVKLLDSLDNNGNFFQFLSLLDYQAVISLVEKLRKEALKLHESRDQLLIRIEMLKTTDFLAHLKQEDKEDALGQLSRINNRLQVKNF